MKGFYGEFLRIFTFFGAIVKKKYFFIKIFADLRM